MWTIYSNIELISEQQTASAEEPEDEELSSKRKASISSSEPNSEPASQLNSSELNSSELLNSGSSTNESNSNEDINESVLVAESGKKEHEQKSEAASARNVELEQQPQAGHLNVEELYKQMPALALYATVTKNLKPADHLNSHHELMTNGKNYAQWNGRGNRPNRNSLNGCKFSRKPSLSARTTPVMNADAALCCDEANRRSFLLSLHSNLVNASMYGQINSPNNYYSDADSTVSCYEAIDLGSNSIDSGYKSSSCCQTPDCHNSTAGNLIERRNGSARSTSSSSSFHQQQHFEQNAACQPPVNLNDKLIKQFQELMAANGAAVNGPAMTKNNLLMNKGSAQLINSNDLPMINGSMNGALSATAANSTRSQINNTGTLNGNAAFRNENPQLIDCLSGDHSNAQHCLTSGRRTFKSALALKSSNPMLNRIESDYCKVARYKNHRHLSQSEQYLDNLNDDYLGESLYPYLLSSTKSRQLFKNRSNLNLEQYLNKIQQQNELLKQEIEQKEQLNGNYAVVGQQQRPAEYQTQYQTSEYQTAQYQTPEYQPAKVVKRKLPQINHLYSNRSELIRNKLYASSSQMHSSDLRLDQYQTNKYEHQTRFKSIYIMNNKLRKQPHLSASIEQVSNLGGDFCGELRRCALSSSVDGTEEDAINLINTEYQLKANLIKQKNLLKQVNETLALQSQTFGKTEDLNNTNATNEQPIDQQLIDRLYSQVQKHQQKSSSTQSIYYQDYLEGQQFGNKNIESAASLTALTTQKSSQLREAQQTRSNDKKDLDREKEVANNRKNEALNSQKAENEMSSVKNSSSCKQDKEFKTRSADDLYRSMSNLVNHKLNQPNDATSKRRAFRLMGSPLRTLSKAFSSEANDLFRMKELAKSKFANLIDNFASSSTNSSSNKKNSQDKQEKATSNKSPGSTKKSLNNNKTSAPPDYLANGTAYESNGLAKGEQAGNLYVYGHQQIEPIQRQPLPPIPVEHLYEELRTVVDFKKVDLKKVEQQRTADGRKRADNQPGGNRMVDKTDSKPEPAKRSDQRVGQRRDKKLERQERIERTEKQERIARKSDIPEIRINYCKQRSTASSASREQEKDLTRQSRSMEERSCREHEDKLRSYSRSLDEECEEEIIRKVNSDDIISKIDDIITNIEQQLNNKENLNLEYKMLN